jgi:glycerophosphoryl diester phosphodiesterase
MPALRSWLTRAARPALPAAAALLMAVAGPAGAFDLQGHRGARGLAPENTLVAFETALRLGVSTLELDLMMTADGVLVVAHDPALNPDLTRDADGRWLAAPGPLVRSLTLAQLQAYDVGRARPGSTVARNFPQQGPADGQRVPTLAQVFALAASLGADAVGYNLEIKRRPDRPDDYAPLPLLVDALLAEIARAGVGTRAVIQSFDWAVLQRVQQAAPQATTSYLSIQRPNFDNIGSPGWTGGVSLAAQGTVPKMVHAAGGRIWSPFFRDLTAAQVREAQALGLKVVPWTVNEPADLLSVLALGVDGLITDYPDRARDAMRARGLPLPAPVPAPTSASTSAPASAPGAR